jgi:hypothetical protein
VAFLWGLPVDGIPIIDVSDDDWTPLKEAFFGRHIDASAWMSKRRGTGDQTVYTFSFSLKLSWLWEHFSILPEDATPAQIDQYMRAFCDGDIWDDIISRLFIGWNLCHVYAVPH